MRNTWRTAGIVGPALLLASVLVAPAQAGHNADEHSPDATLLANIPRSSVQTQSDLAFQGDLAIAGNYNGFRVIDISDPADPHVVRDVWCPGPQSDVSIWGDAIVVSQDTVLTGSSCDSATAAPQTLETGFEGLRVFSLSEVLADTPDPDGFTRLEPLAAVYTECGSHTHTGVPDGDRVLIYVSSYSLRSGPDCGPHDDPSDTHNPVHMKISIVELPLADPASTSLLKTAPVDMPLWTLLSGPGFNPLGGCHDMQVFPEEGLAAAACASVGQLWDISDPENPQTLTPLWVVDEPQVQFYHSAAFTWDAKVVIFGDEIVFGSCDDGTGSGQIWFHDAADGSTEGSFQIARPQPGQYCSAHLFNVLPTSGYTLVASWYAGGTTVIHFKNPANPVELAYYDPAPLSSTDRGHWSAYGYNGHVYSNGLTRGFDTFFIEPARAGSKKFPDLNPQTQIR